MDLGAQRHDWVAHPALRALTSPAMLMTPELIAPSAWIEHTPFAAWLIDAQAPELVVELGSHNGPSYFAFCQAIQSFDVAARAVAIDTWEGDPQAGVYGEDVYQAVAAHNRRYEAFSTLMRMRFEEAVGDFADGSIDLLHIDGLHTYDAVRADFETWAPKLSDRAVVLFHDTQVAKEGFGVTRYWGEISAGRPAFEFLHCNGLGVLGVGENQPERLRLLFEAARDPAATAAIRTAFASLGARQTTRLKFQQIETARFRFSRLLRGLAYLLRKPGSAAMLLQQQGKDRLAPP